MPAQPISTTLARQRVIIKMAKAACAGCAATAGAESHSVLACPSIFVLWRCVGCVGYSIMFGHKIKVTAATGRSPAIWFSGQQTPSMIFDRCRGALPKRARH